MKKLFMLSLFIGFGISGFAQADESRTIVSQSDANDSTTMCGENCNWTLYSDGTLEITGTGAMYDYERTYMGSPAKMDSTYTTPWDAYRAQIKSIDVGNGITSVGSFAFANMLNVENVNLGNKVETIGYAGIEWYTLSGVKQIKIPGSVKSIEDWGLNAFTSADVILSEGLEKIGANVFDNTANLKKLVIPSTVTSLAPEFIQTSSSIEQLYCAESLIKQCNTALEPYGLTALTYKKTDSGYDVYDSTGKLVEQYASMDDLQHKKVNTTYVYDESGKLSQILDKNGVNIAPVTSYTVATATERVEYIGGCEEVKCSLKMWFK